MSFNVNETMACQPLTEQTAEACDHAANSLSDTLFQPEIVSLGLGTIIIIGKAIQLAANTHWYWKTRDGKYVHLKTMPLQDGESSESQIYSEKTPRYVKIANLIGNNMTPLIITAVLISTGYGLGWLRVELVDPGTCLAVGRAAASSCTTALTDLVRYISTHIF